MLNLVQKLEKARKELGYTKVDMANQLGVSRKTYWRWASGGSDPSGENVVEILEWLEEKEQI